MNRVESAIAMPQRDGAHVSWRWTQSGALVALRRGALGSKVNGKTPAAPAHPLVTEELESAPVSN